MTNFDHNRIIKTAARTALKPIGCKQKGSSRTWLDLHSLWVGVIEFQPSDWAKGSYLNVGACWLWYEKDYFSFNEGYRVSQFKEAESEDIFSLAAAELAEQARDEALKLRSKFSTMEAIATHLKGKDFSSIWDNYHAAVAATLVNDISHAEERFSAIKQDNNNHDWVLELKANAAMLHKLSNDPAQFQSTITAIIERTKNRLKIT